MPTKPADNNHQSKPNHHNHLSKIVLSSKNEHTQLYSISVSNRYQCLTDNNQPNVFSNNATNPIPTSNQELPNVKNNSRFNHNSNQDNKPIYKKQSKKHQIKSSNHQIIKSKNITSTTINAIEDQSCGPKAIISADILNAKQSVLLDTGSQINAISQYKLPEEILKNLAPSLRTITSYTGNEVGILGTFITDVVIGKIKLTDCYFYVSRDDRRTIIGTPAIMSNKIVINLSENTITQQDKSELLELQSDCFNITAAELGLKENIPNQQPPPLQMHSTTGITIPKKSTKFIEISARHSVESPTYFATLDAFDHNMDHGILVGKSVSLLSADNPTCIIRLCNINDHEIQIEPMRRIINLHAVSIQDVPINKQSELVQNFSHPTTEINNVGASPENIKFNQVIKDVKIGSTIKANIEAVHQLIAENLQAFATDDEPLGQTDKAVYDINTGDSPPVAQSRYRTPYYLRNEMKQIIDKNVESGLMEPCSSPYAAPVLLVKKKSGKWRLVCDYRRLNEVTISDSYPLPAISDLVTNLSSSKIFSSADLWTGFHQIPCSEKAKEKLAITTEFGQYTWLSMPMGGKNAPSVFQRLMDTVFRSIPRDSLLIYLDDLLVHSLTEEDNITQLRRVLQTLIANNLKIRASKTECLMSEIQFCGYILSDGSKKPNPTKVEAVKLLRSPTSKSEAQSVFGLLNYHRFFIKHFAKKAAPITKAYKGRFQWTDEAQSALQLLKEQISDSALKLKIPDVTNGKFVLETDASKDGYGACLFICTSDKPHNHGPKCLRPVEYASRQFDVAQRNYSTLEKELLAGREALRKWSHFLLGRKFTWRTDNACLQWAHKVRSRILKVSQWLAEISEYDIVIERRPSSTMKVSDCLSRSFAELQSLQVTKTDLRDLQENDPVMERVRHYASIGRWPNQTPPNIREYFLRRSNLMFGTSGELLLRGSSGLRTLPPTALTEEILKSYHDKNGHPGEKQTIDQLEKNYFWPTLSQDAKNYIHSCHKCQTTKPNLRPKQPPKGLSETPTGPWQMISWDLIGPLPITEKSYKFVLTGFDLFSKRVYGRPLQTKSSDVVGNSIRHMLMQNPQMPKTILTDNGTEFATLSDLCREFQITHKTGAAYHPETNGGCERANQTLKNRLFCDDMETWDERLDHAVHSINCSKHAVTGLSPFAIETGHPGRNIHDFVEHSNTAQANNQRHIEETRTKIVQEKQARFQKFNNENFDPYNVGDKVLARNMVAKFPRYLGPLEIIYVRGNGLSYVLKDLKTGKKYTRAVKQLKSYCERPDHMFNQNERPIAEPDVEMANIQSRPRHTTALENVTNEPESVKKIPFSCDDWDIFRFRRQPNELKTTTNSRTMVHNLSIASENDEFSDYPCSSVTHTVEHGMPAKTKLQTHSSSLSSSDSSSIASDHSNYQLKLTNFNKKQLLDLAQIHNIPINGPMYDQVNQIDQWFQEKFPNHPRSRGLTGILTFPSNYIPKNETTLSELKRKFLLNLIDDYSIPKPTFYKKTNDLRKYIKSHLDKHIPDHPKTETGLYLFTKNEHDASRALGDNTIYS